MLCHRVFFRHITFPVYVDYIGKVTRPYDTNLCRKISSRNYVKVCLLCCVITQSEVHDGVYNVFVVHTVEESLFNTCNVCYIRAATAHMYTFRFTCNATVMYVTSGTRK